ncbi:hypothetical protein [Nodosilinea sp. FACHB-13]|uniref:hypothetical protein n=1 Tax=Cyanophyceae TaxID=3028117 RepID=UPI0016898FBB|nr:hypothetical protein [Nodosilinea sp. FACHB-13]MBD2106771.1 hypothetical protein [Nodosilinea sp. FACHB-13]
MLLAPLSVIAVIWCLWLIDDWGLTPERAARRDGLCKHAPAIKAQQQTPTTAIVVCQGWPTPPEGAYVRASRLPWGVWWAPPNGGTFSYESSEAVSTELIDYIHFGPTQSVHTSLILLGRSRSAEVAVMEAKLSDGRTLSNEVTNGLFVFDAPIQAVGVKVDELKIIGQDNQVLQLIQAKPGY